MLKGSTGPRGGILPKDKEKKQDPLALGMLGEAFLKVHGMEAKIDALSRIVEGNGKETLVVRLDRLERLAATKVNNHRVRWHAIGQIAIALVAVTGFLMALMGG